MAMGDEAEWSYQELMKMGGKTARFVAALRSALKESDTMAYLSMMAVTKAPELCAAGVPIVPFVNWFTEIENEDPILQQSDLATMGDPKQKPDFFRDRSPFFFVDQIKAPLLLLAGGHDPRCPKEEAIQVADEIKKHGGVVDYKIYEDEGHGFSRVENQIDAYQRVANFVKAHVPPADCGCKLE